MSSRAFVCLRTPIRVEARFHVLDTAPAQREALFAAMPEVAAFARPAIRLHPRRAELAAEQSSAGGPLLVAEARDVADVRQVP